MKECVEDLCRGGHLRARRYGRRKSGRARCAKNVMCYENIVTQTSYSEEGSVKLTLKWVLCRGVEYDENSYSGDAGQCAITITTGRRGNGGCERYTQSGSDCGLYVSSLYHIC